jgi:hypothetical protein
MDGQTTTWHGKYILWLKLLEHVFCTIIIASTLIMFYYLKSTNFCAAWKQVETRLCFLSCSAYYSNLKMEVVCSSKMSVDFQQTTWCYIPEDLYPPLWKPQILCSVIFNYIIYFSVLCRWRQQIHSEHHYIFMAYMHRRPQSSYSLLWEHQISQGIGKFIN